MCERRKDYDNECFYSANGASFGRSFLAFNLRRIESAHRSMHSSNEVAVFFIIKVSPGTRSGSWFARARSLESRRLPAVPTKRFLWLLRNLFIGQWQKGNVYPFCCRETALYMLRSARDSGPGMRTFWWMANRWVPSSWNTALLLSKSRSQTDPSGADG